MPAAGAEPPAAGLCDPLGSGVAGSGGKATGAFPSQAVPSSGGGACEWLGGHLCPPSLRSLPKLPLVGRTLRADLPVDKEYLTLRGRPKLLPTMRGRPVPERGRVPRWTACHSSLPRRTPWFVGVLATHDGIVALSATMPSWAETSRNGNFGTTAARSCEHWTRARASLSPETAYPSVN